MSDKEQDQVSVGKDALVGERQPTVKPRRKSPTPRKSPVVKDANLRKAFKSGAKDLLEESRDREIAMKNIIDQQSTAMDQLQSQLKEQAALIESFTEQAQTKAEVVDATPAPAPTKPKDVLTLLKDQFQSMQAQLDKLTQGKQPITSTQQRAYDVMLKKSGLRQKGNDLFAGPGGHVTPTSPWNIPNMASLHLAKEDDDPNLEDDTSLITAPSYQGAVPLVVTNPGRDYVRVNDLKNEKDDEGCLIQPFETIDLAEMFEEKKIRASRGLRYALKAGLLKPAKEGYSVGQPPAEPDSLQRRFAKYIGKVPRRAKVKRDPRTGKPIREQGIDDPALQAAAEAHVKQRTIYDKELEEVRELNESGQNIVGA